MGVVLLVRHGQASFGADDYDVLSATGWAQSRLLGAWLAGHGVTPDVVLRGDLRRHRETVAGMVDGAAWAPVAEVDSGWDEFDHLAVVGALPGLPPMESLDRPGFQRVFELATARWAAGAHDDEYPEPYRAFVARVRAALDRACARAGPGGTALVVTSGGPVATACAALVDPDGEDPATAARVWGRFNTVLVNTSVTRIVVGSTGARLLTFNEHQHLAGDLLSYR